jgi:hypothetical protein
MKKVLIISTLLTLLSAKDTVIIEVKYKVDNSILKINSCRTNSESLCSVVKNEKDKHIYINIHNKSDLNKFNLNYSINNLDNLILKGCNILNTDTSCGSTVNNSKRRFLVTDSI